MGTLTLGSFSISRVSDCRMSTAGHRLRILRPHFFSSLVQRMPVMASQRKVCRVAMVIPAAVLCALNDSRALSQIKCKLTDPSISSRACEPDAALLMASSHSDSRDMKHCPLPTEIKSTLFPHQLKVPHSETVRFALCRRIRIPIASPFFYTCRLFCDRLSILWCIVSQKQCRNVAEVFSPMRCD